MKVKQISVFLENKSGRLAKVTKILGENNINIRALSIADTSDFGILRLIVDKPDIAFNLLKNAAFSVSETEVIAVEMPDKPGGLAEILSLLEKSNINVEYVYAFIGRNKENAIVIIRVDEVNSAEKILKENEITIIEEDTINFYW